MSSWAEFRAVWKTLTDEQKAQVPDAIREFFAKGPSEVKPDEFVDQVLEQAKVMVSDTFDNIAWDMRYAVLERLQGAENELERIQPEMERLQALAGEHDPQTQTTRQFFMENCIAFWQAAEKRYESHGDVDALMYSQHRLNPDWEIRDWYAQEGVPAYSGADIRTMLIERGFRAEAIHIDDAKTYKMPHSPGGGADLWRIADWGNAYYYKAMAHYVGVESVAITNFGTIIGVEERHQTAGAQGIVARFPRPYRADPGSVLPREWNNAIIWPEPSAYTEIRF